MIAAAEITPGTVTNLMKHENKLLPTNLMRHKLKSFWRLA
jgi:hypothetical protein